MLIQETEKISVTYRLSKTGRNILKLLSKKLALSHTSLVEIALRDLAKKENVDFE